MRADGDRGHCQRSQLSPLPSWLPVLSLPLQYGYSTLVSTQNEAGAAGPSTAASQSRTSWDEELSLDILSSYTSSLVPATTLSWSLCRLYMCKIPFPACFGIRACPAQELSPFPSPHPCSGSELAAVAGGTGGALSSHHLLLVFNLTGWGLTPWREREQDPSGEESPACRQGHLPTCTDIFYRHGCTCVDNMVF